ncbi:MAG: methyltransferase [Chitinophagaceae bacterium]|nr:methyltransferase [Chitinophagaceae bacterium]
MANTYFQFKQFIIHQDRSAMKVTTDACLFGAWVARQIKLNREQQGITNSDKLLDIGTGTGLLSLMLAQENSLLNIDALEIDVNAAGQAFENCQLSPWRERIRVSQGDIKQTDFNHPFRYILSNPPFYENDLRSPDPIKNLAHHQEGLLLKDFPAIIQNHLEPGGQFYLLLPFKRKEEIIELLQQNGFSISNMVQVKQTINHPYFRLMLEAEYSNAKVEVTEINELIISNKANEYSSEFISLLKEYYLHL